MASDIRIQEPNDLPGGVITEETASRLAVIVYSKEPDSGGIKKIGFLPWKTFLDYDSSRTKNIGTLIGFEASEYDKDGQIIPAPDTTVIDRIKSIAEQAGVNFEPVIVEKSLNSRLTEAETTISTQSSTIKDQGDAIEILQGLIGEGSGSDQGLIQKLSALNGRVEIIETNTQGLTVELVGQITTNKNNIETHEDRITELETNTEGLSSELISQITTNKNDIETLNGIVSDEDTGLVKQVETNTKDIATIKSDIGSAYRFQGNIKDQSDYDLAKNKCTELGKSGAGCVYNISVAGIIDGTTTYDKGVNIAWVYVESGTSYFDPLSETFIDPRIDNMWNSLKGSDVEPGIESKTEELYSRFVHEQSKATPTWNTSTLTDGTYIITAVKSSDKSSFMGILTVSSTSESIFIPVLNQIEDYFTVESSNYKVKQYVSVQALKVS